jgi:hypothetical protein
VRLIELKVAPAFHSPSAARAVAHEIDREIPRPHWWVHPTRNTLELVAIENSVRAVDLAQRAVGGASYRSSRSWTSK